MKAVIPQKHRDLLRYNVDKDKYIIRLRCEESQFKTVEEYSDFLCKFNDDSQQVIELVKNGRPIRPKLQRYGNEFSLYWLEQESLVWKTETCAELLNVLVQCYVSDITDAEITYMAPELKEIADAIKNETAFEDVPLTCLDYLGTTETLMLATSTYLFYASDEYPEATSAYFKDSRFPAIREDGDFIFRFVYALTDSNEKKLYESPDFRGFLRQKLLAVLDLEVDESCLEDEDDKYNKLIKRIPEICETYGIDLLTETDE